jgi:hypothetical protein
MGDAGDNVGNPSHKDISTPIPSLAEEVLTIDLNILSTAPTEVEHESKYSERKAV